MNMADIINQVDGQVQVIFEKGQGSQTYRDAIWMTQNEYDSVSTETLESIKQERYDNWLAVVNAMPTEEVASITEE
jgi:GTP cyclohydrolase III